MGGREGRVWRSLGAGVPGGCGDPWGGGSAAPCQPRAEGRGDPLAEEDARQSAQAQQGRRGCSDVHGPEDDAHHRSGEEGEPRPARECRRTGGAWGGHRAPRTAWLSSMPSRPHSATGGEHELEHALFLAERRVLNIQTKLHRWARDDSHRRFDDLDNLVADPGFLLVAWDRVRGNKGARTAGVDGRTARSVEAGQGVRDFLGGLRSQLKDRSVKPRVSWRVS